MTYWDDSLLIGVPLIDRQHRALVSALDTLTEECARGKWPDTIEKTLNFIIAYTKEHFADEERVQAECGFPEMEAHKRMHADLILQVSLLVDELQKSGRSIDLFTKINKALVDWVIHHIGAEDKKIGLFIQSKGEI